MRPFIPPNWAEERQTFYLRVLFTLILLLLLGLEALDVHSVLIRLLLVLLLVQIPLSLWGMAARWRWMGSFSHYYHLVLLTLALGASGGGSSPFVGLCYMLLAARLRWFQGVLSWQYALYSQFICLWMGSVLDALVSGEGHWVYAATHSLFLTLTALYFSGPLVRLGREALTDPLTETLNRRGGLAELGLWIGQSRPFGLIYLDIKDFKHLNDRLGHGVGDEVLVGITRWLRSQLRAHDLLIRHGGDEFVIAALEGVEGLSQRLSSSPIRLDSSKGMVAVELNLGQAHFPQDADTLERLLSLADERMYRHKGKHDPRPTPYV
jgi:diguanylate cyclase (GGDEF)-like protein